MAPDRGTRQPRRPGHRHGRVTGQHVAPVRERADRERGPGTQDHLHAHRHDTLRIHLDSDRLTAWRVLHPHRAGKVHHESRGATREQARPPGCHAKVTTHPPPRRSAWGRPVPACLGDAQPLPEPTADSAAAISAMHCPG